MSKPKHTQGDWRVGDGGFTVFGPKMSDGTPAETIATVRKPANARLIAAAPEMLEALILALPYLKMLEKGPADGLPHKLVSDDLAAINAAIAKAEGRS